MNWANRITLVRIILIPILGIFMTFTAVNYNHSDQDGFWHIWNTTIGTGNYHLPISYLVSGIVFVVASLTDMLDGYIARKYNQVTTFGKFFDSIADKLLTNVTLIIMACGRILPIWMVVTLICRDFVIDVVRQILASERVIMAANQLGRYRAAVEMVGLTLMFFVGYSFFGGVAGGTHSMWDEYGWVNQVIMIPMYIALILSIAAALNYIILNRRILFAGVKTNAGVTKNNETK